MLGMGLLRLILRMRLPSLSIFSFLLGLVEAVGTVSGKSLLVLLVETVKGMLTK